MTWENKLKPEKHIKKPFYAVSVSRDRIGVTTKYSWNNLDLYGSLPTVSFKQPKWKKQLFGYRVGTKPDKFKGYLGCKENLN